MPFEMSHGGEMQRGTDTEKKIEEEKKSNIGPDQVAGELS